MKKIYIAMLIDSNGADCLLGDDVFLDEDKAEAYMDSFAKTSNEMGFDQYVKEKKEWTNGSSTMFVEAYNLVE